MARFFYPNRSSSLPFACSAGLCPVRLCYRLALCLCTCVRCPCVQPGLGLSGPGQSWQSVRRRLGASKHTAVLMLAARGIAAWEPPTTRLCEPAAPVHGVDSFRTI